MSKSPLGRRPGRGHRRAPAPRGHPQRTSKLQEAVLRTRPQLSLTAGPVPALAAWLHPEQD